MYAYDVFFFYEKHCLMIYNCKHDYYENVKILFQSGLKIQHLENYNFDSHKK